ncbi:MAG: prepilin-type N-terminal cleavage/methylation domain-containing protein [Gallionella sp.]|nr:prepilin-type N-terminal cleavage/methylation domain-containing protein [Gallionella sp.]
MNASSGFTLVEMLIVTVIMGIAAAAIPMLSSNDPQKLSVAAEETTNLLRFALSEARRSGGYVLVDGKSSAGQLSLYNSDSSGNLSSAITDPLTKRAATLDVTGNPFSQGVTLLPQFQAGGSPYAQLLIGPGITQLQVFNGASTNIGVLQSGSGVLLNYGGQSVTVGINELTGLVTLL